MSQSMTAISGMVLMTRNLIQCVANAVRLAIVAGAIVGTTCAAEPAKSKSKSRQSAATVVRAQNAEKQATAVGSEHRDEEIFDQDLETISSFSQVDLTAPCVMPVGPNCTDVFGTPSQSAMPGQSPTPDNAAFPTPQMPSSPAPGSSMAQLPSGTGALGNSSNIPGFAGDFFGGSVASGSVANSILGQFTLSRNGNPNDFVQVTSNGGVPNQFQTTNTYANRTLGGVFSLPGQQGLALVSGRSATVQFNPPESGSPVNPQVVTIYNLASNSNTGGIDPALTTGRTKLAEGSSPIPRDRVFFNYSYFDNAKLTSNGIYVNRYTPGIEKTFFNGNASVELRLPFASTLSSNIDTSTGFVNPTDFQFGNVTIYTKALLYQNSTFACSTGLGFTVPTASNINFRQGSQQTLRVSNDSVHLLPFVGGVYTPNDRFYSQGFLQFDFDSNGNRVYSTTDLQGVTGNSLNLIGRVQDAAFLYASVNAGYWVYRSDTPGTTGLTGFSPIAELHYNRSLQSGDQVAILGQPVYGQSSTNVEVLNAVIGANMLFGRSRILTTAFTTPLGMGVDRQFNGELRVMFNWYFGGGNSSPATRVGRAQF